MSHARLWVASAIIACIVLIGFILSVPHTRDVTETSLAPASNIPPEVIVHDSFKKGIHTITGTVAVPNACASVNADAHISEGMEASSTSNILIALTIADDAGICLQLPAQASFKATVSTSTARLPLVVTVNGLVATTTTP